jgi:hypothetical protein
VHAVHTFLGAGVSYNIIDLNIKLISVVRWMISSKFKSLEDSTRDQPTNGLLSLEIYS